MILRNGNQKLVRVSAGFANVLKFEMVPLRDGRRGLSEEDLVAAYEAAHCAEGRDGRQTAGGQCIEDPDQAEEIWRSEYEESASEIMRKFGVS